MPLLVCSVVFPAKSKHTATLFFLHGLGDSAQGGWSDLVPEFQQAFPGLKVVLPNAPVNPVTLNGGMRMQSWHDICSLSRIDSEQFVGLEDSRKIVEALLNEEIASGTASNRIVLGGFSQGAAMSLYTGLQFPHRLAGIAALSGYLPWSKPVEQFGPAIAAGGNKDTPVLMLHGEADQVVRLQFGERSHKAIQTARGKDNLQWKTYRGMGHHSCEEEMAGQLSSLA
jgi:predicted esterase